MTVGRCILDLLYGLHPCGDPTSSHSAKKKGLRASTFCVRAFSISCGSCATSQQAIETRPAAKPTESETLQQNHPQRR